MLYAGHVDFEDLGFDATPVYDRYKLGIDDELTGPAVVEEEGSTLVVGPAATARVASSGNIIMTLSGQ